MLPHEAAVGAGEVAHDASTNGHAALAMGLHGGSRHGAVRRRLRGRGLARKPLRGRIAARSPRARLSDGHSRVTQRRFSTGGFAFAADATSIAVTAADVAGA